MHPLYALLSVVLGLSFVYVLYKLARPYYPR